jgi:hypothetical protein
VCVCVCVCFVLRCVCNCIVTNRYPPVSVTFRLVSVPSSIRDFEFSTDVESGASFVLSDASSQHVYSNVTDGAYQVTLPSNEATGYDVDVSCVGAGSATTVGDTTTFDVIGGDVTCTFTLTGM